MPDTRPGLDALRAALIEELYGLGTSGETRVRIEEAVAAINSRWSIETRHAALSPATGDSHPPLASIVRDVIYGLREQPDLIREDIAGVIEREILPRVGDSPIIACPRCGGEGYDNVFIGDDGIPRHCGADVSWPPVGDTRPGLQDVIDGLARAYDDVKPEPGMDGPHGGHIGGVTRERAAIAIQNALDYLASPATGDSRQSEGLDVERLARALRSLGLHNYPDTAADLAAEYARLAAAAPKEEPDARRPTQHPRALRPNPVADGSRSTARGTARRPRRHPGAHAGRAARRDWSVGDRPC